MTTPVRAMAAGVVLLLVSLLIGAGGIATGMLHTPRHIAEPGLGNPEELAAVTDTTALTIMIGMAVAALGMALFAGGLFVSFRNHRNKLEHDPGAGGPSWPSDASPGG